MEQPQTGAKNPNLSPAPKSAGSPKTFKPRMATVAAVVAVAVKPKGGNEPRRDREDERREPKPDPRHRGKSRGEQGQRAPLAGPAVKMGDGWRRAEPVPTAGVAEQAALVAAAAAIAAESTQTTEQEAEVEARAETELELETQSGRKVAERVSRGRTKPDRDAVFAEDVEYLGHMLGKCNDACEDSCGHAPASSEKVCGLHTDCGNWQLAHGVLKTSRLPRLHVMTLCSSGRAAFKRAEGQRNEETGQKVYVKFFGVREATDTLAGKLAEAQAFAEELEARWSVGRRVGGAKKSDGGTSADEIKAKGRSRSRQASWEGSAERQGQVDEYDTRFWHWLDALYQRVHGTDAPRPRRSGNPKPKLDPSPYLICTVLAGNAAHSPSVSSGTHGRQVTIADIRRANERLREARKQLVVERRKAQQERRRAKFMRGVPAAERILRSAASRKGWYRRRQGDLSQAVTPALLVAKPELVAKPKKRRSPVKRGRYIATNRRQHTPQREISVGFTVHNALTARNQMLAAMGCSDSSVPQRGAAVAGTGKPGGDK